MGFIIDDPLGCNRCGRVAHADRSPVTWLCAGCGKLTCRYCAIRDPTGREILTTTLCSRECRLIHDTTNIILQLPLDDEDA